MKAATLFITLIIALAATQCRSDSAINKELKQAATELNAECPKMIDPHTRLDKVTPGHMAITYHYTIVNSDDETIRISSGTIESSIRSGLVGSPETKRLLDAGVTMSYEYNNPAGENLIPFDVKE